MKLMTPNIVFDCWTQMSGFEWSLVFLLWSIICNHSFSLFVSRFLVWFPVCIHAAPASKIRRTMPEHIRAWTTNRYSGFGAWGGDAEATSKVTVPSEGRYRTPVDMSFGGKKKRTNWKNVMWYWRRNYRQCGCAMRSWCTVYKNKKK